MTRNSAGNATGLYTIISAITYSLPIQRTELSVTISKFISHFFYIEVHDPDFPDRFIVYGQGVLTGGGKDCVVDRRA